MRAHYKFTFSTTQQAYITQKIYDQLKSWEISKDFDNSSVDSSIERETEWVVRCWVDFNGKLEMSKTPLNHCYVGCSRSVAQVQLSIDPDLPREAKHDQRDGWDHLANKLNVDEILLCDPLGHVLEAHNSNFWIMECYDNVSLNQINDRLLNGDPLALRGTCWVTPPLEEPCLPGVTRALLIDILKNAGAIVYPKRINLKMHQAYDLRDPMTPGAFKHYYYLSSTLKSLSPISKIDDQTIERPLVDPALCTWIDHQLGMHID